MDQIRLTLLPSEADTVRPILREHMRNGIWFTERRWLWLWVRFAITGPKQGVAALKASIAQAEYQDWASRIW